jgi:hypothetical protein
MMLMSTVPDADEQLPLCFVLMPFNVKTDASGTTIDFDSVYRDAIGPAIVRAGMEAFRADQERDGGIIHKPMFERLLLCDYAVADLTFANANVFYELGVRHAARPHTTVLICANTGSRLPFDVAPLRVISYGLSPEGHVEDVEAFCAALSDRLTAARNPAADSPFYQLLDGVLPPDIAHVKTDVFRDRVRYNEKIKAELARARQSEDPASALAAIHERLRPIESEEAGVVIDLFLSYRSTQNFEAMISLFSEMSAPLGASVLVREQLALALNREGRGEEAEEVLLALVERQGPSSETLGLLGRVYKDRWNRARASGSPAASALLAKAIDAYRRGYEADWRDAYPGVNAVTLLEIQNPGQPEVAELVPVVRYAAQRRATSRTADYWDRATLLELAVIGRDQAETDRRLAEALAERSDPWMRESTGDNLTLIAEARENAGEDSRQLRDLIERLRA